MIDFKLKALELEPRRWERFKIKYGFSGLPDFACPTINDFLNNRDKIGVMKQVVFPTLSYNPLNADDRKRLGWEDVAITLKDITGEMEVYVRPTMYNPQTGSLADEIKVLGNGGTLYHVIVRNGVIWPTLKGNTQDDRIYLCDFRTRWRSKNKIKLSETLSEILKNIFPEPSLQAVPI